MGGPHVFEGYYNDPDTTAETLEDGWLRTGDLGALDDDGYLSITGRKKDLIITSSGKNITPANIESALRETPWISEAVVYGDRRPYLVALLVLDPRRAARAGRAARRSPPTSGDGGGRGRARDRARTSRPSTAASRGSSRSSASRSSTTS